MAVTEAPRLDEDLGWKLLEVVLPKAASFRAMIEQSETHGQFRYCIERYFGPADEDGGKWPDGFWQVTLRSGLYGSLDGTVKAARASLNVQGAAVAN
jgi:hypothetical protein